MPDATPILDADAVRRAIAAAQDDVYRALRRLAARAGRHAARLSTQERGEARTLDELGHEVAELRAVARSSTDTQLLERAHELKTRADDVIRRTGELPVFAPPDPSLDIDQLQTPVSDAFNDVLDAINATAEELASAALDEDDPFSWLWDARLLSYALLGLDDVLDALVDRVARSQLALRAYDARQAGRVPRAEAAATRAHLAAAPRRLRAAGAAARLAARRSNLVELHELVHEFPRTETHIDGTRIQITLRNRQPANGYGLRVNNRPYPDALTLFSDAELTGEIAAAAGLDLGDLAQRRRAHEHAERARHQLAAIVAYRDSTRRGNPQDAANTPDPSTPQIPDSSRPDSRTDLVDLLLDLVDEGWPIATVLHRSLAVVCDALGEGDHRRGIARLLAHPDNDPTAAVLVGQMLLVAESSGG